jgi:AcrR family transcriptional regulator
LADQAITTTGKRRGRPREGGTASDSRARVLGVARRLFAHYGFERTSIRQIAQALDIVSASLYHHFPTKEQMLHEILREPVLDHAGEALRIALLPMDAERRLVRLIVLRIQTWFRDWEAHEIATNESRFFRERDEFDYVQRAKEQGYRAHEAVLQDGMAAGLFRGDLDVYFTINLIWSVLNTATVAILGGKMHTITPPVASRADIFRFHIDAILRVVRAVDRISEPMPDEELGPLAD